LNQYHESKSLTTKQPLRVSNQGQICNQQHNSEQTKHINIKQKQQTKNKPDNGEQATSTVETHRRDENREGSQKHSTHQQKPAFHSCKTERWNQQNHPEGGGEGKTADENRLLEEEGAKPFRQGNQNHRGNPANQQTAIKEVVLQEIHNPTTAERGDESL